MLFIQYHMLCVLRISMFDDWVGGGIITMQYSYSCMALPGTVEKSRWFDNL